MPAVPAIIAGAAAVGGAYMSSEASRKAAGAAGEHITSSADAYRDMSRPYRQLGKSAANILFEDIGGWNKNSNARDKYLKQYGSDWADKLQSLNNRKATSLTSIAMPQLQNRVSVNLANDPIYQQQVRQGMSQLNRRYAAMGSANSSDADNAVARNMLDYYTNAYSRAEGDVNRSNQNALTSYGLQYNRANDVYNRNYNNLMAQYGLENSAEQNYFNRLFNFAQLGANATAQQGNALMQSGNALAGIEMQNGANQSNAIGTGIAGILGAYNNYNMYNYLNKNP